MPAPNFGGLIVCLWAKLAVPILLGAIAILLAASEGAAATVQLAGVRRLTAWVGGGVSGLLVLAAAVLVADRVPAAAWFGLHVAGILAGCVAGGLTAYRTARRLSERLNRYRCRSCGAQFRCRVASRLCEQCSALNDEAQLQRAQAEFADRLATTTPRGQRREPPA